MSQQSKHAKIRRFRQQLKKNLSLGITYLCCLCLVLSCQGSTESVLQTSEELIPPPPIEREAPAEAVVKMPPPVDRNELNAHLTQLSVERATDQQKQTARNYIETHLAQNNWDIEEQPFPGGINIIAHRPQDNSIASGEFHNQGEILVGAHYDTIKGTPGADDNATGVAAILEFSRIFQTYQSLKTLTLAFFDLEEDGAVGSSAYTNQPEHLANLDGVIILEMLGYTCDTPNCQGIPPELEVQPPSQVGDFLSVIGDQEHPVLLEAFRDQANSTLQLLSLKVPFKGLLSPILLRSDHAPFWLKGTGAVMVSDTAFLRNPNYHRATDTVSTIDLDFFTQSSNLISRATATLLNQANASEP